MIQSINPLYGQSNLDLSLKATGSLDNYINFCNNNNITNLNKEATIYLFDSNSVINKVVAGKNYATKNISGRFFDATFFDSTFFQ